MTIAPELDFAPCGNDAAPCASIAPLPPNEAARLQALRDYDILDTAPERAFDRITRLAATVFDAPIATVSLVDAERQWFKSSVGLDVCETHRDGSFCSHAILTDAVMIVPDATEDPRFAANPLVTGAPHIRFYAGAPLRSASGFNLGTVCIIDRVPREFGPAQAAILADFAAIVSEALEERLAAGKLAAEIAERRKSEESLRLVSAAVAHARDSIMITDAALDFPGPRILFTNQAHFTLTGYTLEEIQDATPRIMQGPDTDKAVLKRLRATLARGEEFEGETINYRKDGTAFRLEWQIAPIRDAQNVVTHFVAIQRDVSERWQAEEALREREERFRTLVEATAAIVWDTPVLGTFETEQPSWSAFTGQTFAELHRWGWLNAVHPEDRAETARAWITAVKSRVAYEVQHRLRAADGTYRHMMVRAVPVLGEDDQITRWIGVHTDITEMKRVEAERAEMNRQLIDVSRQAGMAEVATSVLHNVGNVLNSVNVSATVVAERAKESKVGDLARVVTLLDEHAEDIGAFVSSDRQGKNIPVFLRRLSEQLAREQQSTVTELTSLRENIKHIKHIVAAQQSYASFAGVTEVVELSDLVEDALSMNSSSLHRHDVQVVREFEKVPDVSVDRHKMLQILVNLVRNARQACDDSGGAEKRLTLRVTNGHEHVRVAVTDNGVGISPENLTRIFAHGFTTKKTGHGFGLHSSALAATECGGTLTVHSDGLGTGATFTLELPAGGPASCIPALPAST